MVLVRTRFRAVAATQVIRVGVDHDGTSNDGELTRQLQQTGSHGAFGTASLISQNVAKVTGVAVRGIFQVTVAFAVGVPVTTSSLAAAAEITL